MMEVGRGAAKDFFILNKKITKIRAKQPRPISSSTRSKTTNPNLLTTKRTWQGGCVVLRRMVSYNAPRPAAAKMFSWTLRRACGAQWILGSTRGQLATATYHPHLRKFSAGGLLSIYCSRTWAPRVGRKKGSQISTKT